MIILVCASSCCVSVKSGSAKLNLKKQFIWKSVVVWKYESANNIENTIFKSLTGDRTAILCGHLVPSFLSYFKTLNIGPPGIKTITFRSTVKHTTGWANPTPENR